MTDEVNYAIPLGILGRMANALFVEKELRRIFKFRYTTIEKLFISDKQTLKQVV
jgi:ligand-binding SRPBCC domain-containing protein